MHQVFWVSAWLVGTMFKLSNCVWTWQKGEITMMSKTKLWKKPNLAHRRCKENVGNNKQKKKNLGHCSVFYAEIVLTVNTMGIHLHDKHTLTGDAITVLCLRQDVRAGVFHSIYILKEIELSGGGVYWLVEIIIYIFFWPSPRAIKKW